ncbi:MAG: DUF6502 family protein [Betaproteobacteria bacterium]
MSTRHHLVLHTVLRILRPMVRLMLRHGVTYTAFASALKPAFLEAAREELNAQSMPVTDSALTLLSGVHRRDVRVLTRSEDTENPSPADSPPASLAGEVVGRWMSDPACLDGQGRPQVLSRAAFDALVSAVSQDVRPRALRDELVRLGVVTCAEDGSVSLAAQGFAPRQGFAEMATLMADNLADHASAATANLQDGANFLEQALYVDRLSPPSAARLHQAAAAAWQQVIPGLLREARNLYDLDQTPGTPLDAPPPGPAGRAPHRRRVRMGVYFYDTEDDPR